MRKIPIGMSRWIAASFMIALATRATGPVVGRTAAQAEVKQHRGQRLDRSDSRDPAGVDQATPPTDLPWHIEVLDQAAGSTGPVVIAGPLAYVGRGPVVAVADLSDPLQPRWVGQSAALYGEVTDLAMTQGHLLATVGRDGIDEHLISLNIAQVTTPRLVGELDLPTSSLGLFAGSGQAWLSVVDQVWPENGTKVSIMALSLDGSGRPIAQRLWNAAGPGWQRPFHAPILRPVGERDLLVAGLVIDNRFGSIWNFSRELDGRLLPRSRVEYDNRHFSDTENRAMAVDEQGRRAFGSEDSTLRVFDILEDGLLQERGSMTLPESVGCGGLTWTGRWLLASSGCRGSTSVALIDAADPDAPRLAATLTSGRSIARLAMSGKHLVATGGDQGGLTILRADQLPSMSELGHLEEVPVYTGVVQTVSGRFGIAEGQGIVRLGAPTQAAWAQSALVYALPDVLDLVAGPDGQLVAAEGRRYDAGPAQLHVLSTSDTGLHLEQRIPLEASIAGDLTVIGRNLYVGLSQMWKEESRVAPVQRWSFGPNGLTLDARTDPRVNGSCFEVDDKVYVAVSGGMILLDPLSLVPLQVLGTDQAQDNVCGFALRTAAGKPPRFVRADDNAVFIQQLEGDKLKTIGRIAPDWPHGVGTVHRLHDVGGYVAALGDAGMFLVDGRSETQLHPLASFPMQWPTDLTPLDAGSPSLAPGRRWVLSSADLGMLLVTTVASPKPTPPIVASPQTWASPTLAPARPLPTAAATPPARRLFLPMVADHERVAWPNPFAEIRSIGPHYRGMATDGDRAWVGDGLTVALLANDGQSATMLDRSANLPAAPRLLVAAPDLLLAVAGQRGLVILSRARDEAPEVLGRLELPDKIVDLVVTADHAYAATTFCGIIAIDLGKPAMPRITSVLDTPTLTRQLLVVDGRLLSRGDAVDSTVAVAIASLANPAVPEWKHQQNLPYFQMATTDGTRLITDAQLEDSQYRLAAFTFNSDETLVEDRPWIEALPTVPGAEHLRLWEPTMAASDDWLLLSSTQSVVAVALSTDGLPEKVTQWVQSQTLDSVTLAVGGRSAWAIAAGPTIGGPDGPSSITRGNLLWLNLDTLEAGAPLAAPAHTWFSDTPWEPAAMVRFGNIVCIGPGERAKGMDSRDSWMAFDTSVPHRVRPLGRLRLPDGVHGMLPTSETSALALRWNLDRRVGSILRLDLTQILQPRVIEEIAVGDQFPSSATRSGNLVAVRMEAGDSSRMVPDSYLLVRDALDQPLAPLGSIASSQEGSWVPSHLFVDRDRGYLSTQSSFLVEGTTTYETRYRTQVYDLATLPPRSLGDLPFQVTALTRIGDDVFALLPTPSSLRSTLATVSLSDPLAASSILQRINLLGNSPLWQDSGDDIGEITALPDGSLVMPVMTWSSNQSRPYEYLLQRLRRSGPSGSWSADPGLALDLAVFRSPSLSYGNGWLTFLGENGARSGLLRDDPGGFSDRGLLHLVRLAP